MSNVNNDVSVNGNVGGVSGGAGVDDSIGVVKKRNGQFEKVDHSKITNRIECLTKGVLRDGTVIGKPLDMSSGDIVKAVIAKIADNITTSELDEYAAKFCASKSPEDYQYSILGGRIVASNHQKNTIGSFVATMKLIYENKLNNGDSYPLLNRDVYKFIMRHSHDLEYMIDSVRDFMFDYFGFETLKRGYFLRRQDNHVSNINVVETPQYMFMRVAIALTLAKRNLDSPKQQLENIKVTYDALSHGKYIHATPTLFNAGTHHQQLSSCFLLGIGDSIGDDGGIPDCWKVCAQISKGSGGIGIGLQTIRATGTLIAGTSGRSDGIIPLIKVIERIAIYVNQGGGRRPGAIKISIEPWHGDIFDFLQLKKNIGIDEFRARGLTYALWMPDLFMKRLKESISGDKKVYWSLMCPHQCPGLYETYGDEFETIYQKYESEGRYIKQVDIMKLWSEILTAQKETGGPDILYKDAVNRKNNQMNLGVIRNSNLCSEILEYSDDQQYAVCNLASISLVAFIKRDNDTGNPYFDYDELVKTCQIAHKNLNAVIDVNAYPHEKCRVSNLRHRPVGLGTQGFADAMLELGISFEITNENGTVEISKEARKFNLKVAEAMYYACISASADLAEERTIGMSRLKTMYDGGLFKYCDNGLDIDMSALSEDDRRLLQRLNPIKDELERDNFLGSYSSFIGSPSSMGKLQFHLWNVDVDNSTYDWTTLLEKISKYGLRNSLVRADMPTATTAQILGNSECTEPYKYCVYTRRVTAGEFAVVNQYMQQDLKDLNLWTDEIKSDIIRLRGSIQDISSIPQHIKDKHRTAYEISPKTLQILAADRGAFIDQTQSTNYYMRRCNNNILTNVHMGAWKMGLKTGMYYLRREPLQHPVQFTVDKGFTVGGDGGDSAEGEACVSCSA